jgi:ribosomal protein L11 methyltransferase
VVDLGTGTGILAIAAGLLGAHRVLAVDVNPLCVRTAERNVELNRLEGVIRVEQGRAEEFTLGPGDLLIANIQSSVVGELVQNGTARLFRRTIFSGLMRSQARDLKTALQRTGAKVIREWDHDMTWYTMLVLRE